MPAVAQETRLGRAVLRVIYSHELSRIPSFDDSAIRRALASVPGAESRWDEMFPPPGPRENRNWTLKGCERVFGHIGELLISHFASPITPISLAASRPQLVLSIYVSGACRWSLRWRWRSFSLG